MAEGEKLDRLARRINWLDRWRRPIALVLAGITTSLVVWKLVPDNWPSAHAWISAGFLLFFAWYAIEVGLGLVLSIWETDAWQATRPDQMPRATLRKRRRR